jgi:succinate-semialdehyde dehydrogenase / glutarate-semialdehyde dehydrogenase
MQRDAAAATYERLGLFIDGKWIGTDGDFGGRKTQPILNPATNEVLGDLPHATRADLDAALASAQRAFDQWKKVSPMERSAILRKAANLLREQADAIARNMTLDNGKPLAEAKAEALAGAEHIEWHAEEGRRIYGRVIPPRNFNVHSYVVYEPVGVVAAFTPWNFPINQAVRKISAALASGCTIILKGPEDTPSGVVALARVFEQAGVPAGCLNIVWGVPAEVSEYLVSSPIVRKISFTGSVPIGKHLAALAGKYMKRSTMELGGHSPVLVFDDADVEKAAKLLSAFKFRNAGQVCVSPTRFYIHEKAYDRFVATFLDYAKGLKLGSGLAPDTRMGPLVAKRRVEAVQSFVDDSRAQKGVFLTGGEPISGPGNFFAPTIIADLPVTSRLMTEEPFGPIAAFSRFTDTADVIARANSLPFGLSAYVWTGSVANAQACSSGLETGQLNINHFGQALAEVPFGGVKDSGYGSEGGTETFAGYLNTKLVTQMG